MKKNSTGYFSIQLFHQNQLLSGVLTVLAVVAALILANFPFSRIYTDFITMDITILLGQFAITKALKVWVNDGLMTLFFMLIGFEIKRELIAGELSSIKHALYPIIAALGGMIIPIIIFVLFNWNQSTLKGWAIPMATDIAFTLSVILLFGKIISKSLKVAVTALAIIDDLGALLVITLFYTSHISLPSLLNIAAVVFIMWLLNRLMFYNGVIFFVLSIVLWVLFLQSGIHPTIAGVIIAFMIPSNTRINFSEFKEKISSQIEHINANFLNKEKHFEFADETSKKTFGEIRDTINSVEPPLQRYEKSLKPAVDYFIVPFFAFVNTGIMLSQFRLQDLLTPLSLGIIFGLMFGKSTGIFLFSWLAGKTGVAHIPENTSMAKLYGVSWLGGIGFTMSLFIAELSFHDERLLGISIMSICIGSMLSTLVGSIIIQRTKKH